MQVNHPESFKKSVSSVLTDNILAFWTNHAVDRNHGGFVGYISPDNRVVEGANKGAVLNARILWTYSTAFLFLKDPEYNEMAQRAYEYIRTYFKDPDYGGIYWELDYKGNPVNKRKQVYAQAFAIYALSEYYKINADEEALSWAKEIYQLLEQYSHDKQKGGYIEAFTEEWADMEDVRLSEKDANEKKTMNTHLHVLEAYTNLYRVWPDEKLRMALKDLVAIFYDRFLNDQAHLNLFFTTDWKLRNHLVSYGHDIEFSWLLTEAAEALEDHQWIERTRQTAVRIADITMKEGLDKDGGLFNEKNLDTGHLDTDKHWWPQAEAVVGFLNAWEISNEDKFLKAAIESWRFIYDHIIDHEGGEWFWKVDKEGKVSREEEKAGFWKCPYHNTRACIEVLKRMG